MTAAVVVRTATTGDLPAVVAIYGEAVRTSVATFDLTDPVAGYWETRLAATDPGDHFLVATDDRDSVVGFAYSGAFRPRPAYAGTRESSIYLATGARGRGVGRRLYDELIARTSADGVHLLVAVVAQPNPASDGLHRSCGFVEVGTFHEVGRKFERWVDTRWYELRLGESACAVDRGPGGGR
jgi:phosphinothricin acetyltransferase